MGRGIAAGVLGVFLVGCGEEAETVVPQPDAGVQTPMQTPGAGPDSVDPNQPARRAVVLETIDSGGYTYARLDACGSEAWVAGPPTPLTVGKNVSLPAGMVLENFESPTLHRTFEAILFVSWIKVTDEPIDCTPPALPAGAMTPSVPPHDSAGPLLPDAGPSPHGAGGALPLGPDGKPRAGGGAPPHGMSGPAPGHGGPGGPGGMASARPPPPDDLQGKILETMTSGGYTYANLALCDGSTTWVAGPQGKVEVGQTLGVGGSMPMNGFKSSSLDRTFDQLVFAQAIHVVDAPKPCK